MSILNSPAMLLVIISAIIAAHAMFPVFTLQRVPVDTEDAETFEEEAA